MSQFSVGQKVVSQVSVTQHGSTGRLVQGCVYNVLAVNTQSFGFVGNLTRYKVQLDAPKAPPAFWVGNGHLLLKGVK